MHKLILIKILKKISLKLLAAKQDCFAHEAKKNAGFTLIEIIVVVLIVGILAAIAAPSWLKFINRQQANKANDIILSAIQTAQREAKRQKLSYSVSFTTDSNIPYFAIYPSTVIPTADKWKNVLEDLGTNPRKFVIGTNIKSENTINASSNVDYTPAARSSFTSTNKPPQTITFDYMGALDFSSLANTSTKSNNITSVQNSQIGNKGLIIAVNVANGGTKRCVIVRTLLGSIKTAKDSDCI